MTVEEFARYIVDNMGRASLVNALNIPSRISDGNYDPMELSRCIQSYVGEAVSKKILSTQSAYRIIVACDDFCKKYDSEFKYQKRMVLDMLIIDIWEAYQC